MCGKLNGIEIHENIKSGGEIFCYPCDHVSGQAESDSTSHNTNPDHQVFQR